ncbi:electron transfer flavoprotein alpha subunit apoprotein [Fulvimarina manganoxydans]|uniref:Electron transfer flavoprotein alpha subunit apoprotein n=1 Tax=Fulvimarina manganoxydans TaxID=937218 RepID=A0A1W2E7B2_9HYPH|nr:electron transfer flavoprotein subunit alpha/FixB family protein [Fulvimarina manganoxydans]SMD04938.1 electron transfer flavoprotein alpha subunit apoprotein [Fulvimarina manganoxydans]
MIRQRVSPHATARQAASGRPRVNRMAPTKARRLRIDPHIETGQRLRREMRDEASVAAPSTTARSQPSLHVAPADAPVVLVISGVAEAWPGAQADLLGTARELVPDGAIALATLGDVECDPESAGADGLVTWIGDCQSGESRQVGALLAAIAHYRPAHIVLADEAADADLLRRLAVALEEHPALQVTSARGGKVTCLVDAGTRQFTGPAPKLVGLRRSACAAFEGFLRFEARISEIDASMPGREPFTDEGLLPVRSDTLSLTEAEMVVGAGAGVTDYDSLFAVADCLSGAVAGSRVVCDAGSLPRARQVGASGSIIEARFYLAFGISGAPQHLQGIRACRYVVAVNTDPHAPIMERADLAIVADAQAVMRALTERMEKVPQ